MRHTRPSRLAFLLAIPLSLAPGAAPAGAQADAGSQEDVRSRLGGVDLLLLETADGEVVRGQPVGWVDDWILLRDGRRVALGEILRAEALHRRTGEGARWGGLVGLVAGAGLFLASRDDASSDAARGIAYLSGGTLLGAGGGALWGSRHYRGELVYSAPAANAQAPQTGLIEYRLGGGPGQVRTTLALTPFVGVQNFGYRTGTGGDDGARVGIGVSRELGVQLQYAMGPRSVVRFAGSAIHGSLRYDQGGIRSILPGSKWFARAEVGLELRTRANVPGYAVIAADALYNPHGYILVVKPGEGLVPDGVDAGVMPRVGAGLGFDFFAAGDRRVRIEGLYRIGRYNQPDVEALGYDTSRITRDATFSLGVHLPLKRPRPAR